MGKRFVIAAVFSMGIFITGAAQTPDIYDIPAAQSVCYAMDCSKITGIWNFPEDNITVLMFPDSKREGVWLMRVVDSDNGSISPGDEIGEIERSPKDNLYKLKFYGRGKNPLNHSQTFAARLGAEGETLALEKRSFSASFNFFSLLPGLGRLMRISTSDPVSKIPIGLYKIYPGYDNNGSSRLSPRKL